MYPEENQKRLLTEELEEAEEDKGKPLGLAQWANAVRAKTKQKTMEVV